MEKFDIFRDISQRTGGDIYIGVVGPVRTGKSTFIRRFLEHLVLPNVVEPQVRQRLIDSMPQPAAGRTIMTTEPKFVPEDGVGITIHDSIHLNVRMVDCVGYTVPGALGYEEDGRPRMVLTPWFEYEIPFQDAAEIGTRKVIADHSTLGIVVTTDGSIADIPRAAYVDAEERVIAELKEIHKPFIILVNSVHPFEQDTSELCEQLEAKHDVATLPVDCLNLGADDIAVLLERVLLEFPVRSMNVNLPDWLEELEPRHWLREQFEDYLEKALQGVHRLRDVAGALRRLGEMDLAESVVLKSMDMGTGVAAIDLTVDEGLFMKVLSEIAGEAVEGKKAILHLWKDYAVAKGEYDILAGALRDARQTGYGVVPPRLAEMNFEDPELIRQGGRFGVRLRASAPSLHLIRADIETEVTPIIGTEKQCEELLKYLMREFEDDPKRIWQSDIFGKSMHDLVREGIQSKLVAMPENARVKLQETLERIVNEGSGGLICIII
ncbi:MAG: stage IV sporulation protein A [Bacillota bacterium]|nr:stage IV sporulation protein A [Bacillota bacterium]